MNFDQLNAELAQSMYDELGAWQAGSARSQQSSARVLGMSDLGSCREYIRATVAGDPRTPEPLKWAAFVGTALGDLIERALGERLGARTQCWVRVTMPISGIEVSGNCDVLLSRTRLIDVKTKDQLDAVVDDGPGYGQWVQLSGYFVGLVQAGEMDKEGTASLVFFDRSGSQPVPAVFTIDYMQAMSYLEDADERLVDVANALANGESQGHLRDQAESLCYHTSCPFFDACWGPDYQASGVIDAPQHLAAMEMYDRGRRLTKKADALKKQAKADLGGFGPADVDPVEGEGGGWRLKFTLSERGRYVSRTIDLRRAGPKKPARPLAQADVDSWE